MQLVDSHCHLDCLDLSVYDNDLSKLLMHAQTEGVKYFLCVCITQKDFPKMIALVQNYPNVFVTVGTHPNEIVEQESTEDELLKLASDAQVVGIGETGLDYYRTPSDSPWQQERFRRHIHVSLKTKKPLIVHSRQARDDTIKILKEEGAQEVGGVMHCFTEDWDMAKRALDLNFYISFSGIITFQNAQTLRDVAKKVPLSRILIETDSPYLAPVPFRGKPNEPSYVKYVAQKIAEIRELPVATIAQTTTQNFFDLFKEAKPL